MGKRSLLNNVLILSALFLTACATPKPVFDCKRDSAYTKTLDRVLIVSCNEKLTDENLQRHFSRSLTGQIVAWLKEHKVDAHIISPDPNDLGGAELLQTIATYRPHQILFFGPSKLHTQVGLADGVTFRYARGEVANVTFRGKLVDVAAHRAVWNGTMSYWFEPEPDKVAVQLLQKFESDNLLPSLQ